MGKLLFTKGFIYTTFFIFILFLSTHYISMAQNRPSIYTATTKKQDFHDRMTKSVKVRHYVEGLKEKLRPYVNRHAQNPEWIVSRLQMYWNTKYSEVYVNGMDFSHGEGQAPVPTVRFSGSRDWATDYMRPALEDIRPYMDDERGLYLQNGKKDGKPWEWIHPSKTGHIIERINEEILRLAEESAFLFWVTENQNYAVFASDIFMTYIEGMYHRKPPKTFENHKNAKLMGLQTFEVIHERIVEPVTLCYDFLYPYLLSEGADLNMIQAVFKKWADQEIKYGVPDNNWNLMQALYITYLAMALEDDRFYDDKKGQQYYIDQVLNQNSEKQKALSDVVKNYDPETGVWPEVAGYNMLVANDMLEIFSLMDKNLDNNLLNQYPIIEKANLVIFQYLFPHGFTVAYGDAKHSRLRFNALELLIAQYRKYNKPEKEKLITQQLKRFMDEGAYQRDEIRSLFELFFYVDRLMDVPPAASFDELVDPTFYAPNVSWLVQRNGNSIEHGMMVSKNASLGNHSHTNGVNIELYTRGMVIAPDCAAGVSYWTEDHRDYYSRFAAHNTVVVDGISDYRNMRGTQAFELNSIYPPTDTPTSLNSHVTFSDVTFLEPSTNATQHRVTGTVRTGKSSGYFVDIFRSARNDGTDKKHEYLFHSQGDPILLKDFNGKSIPTQKTNELSSENGDLVGYDYFRNKRGAPFNDDFIARFSMPSSLGGTLKVNLWMKGFKSRELFTVEAPYSRAIHKESVPPELYQQPMPTLVVRQNGEARSRPFVSVINAFTPSDGPSVEKVEYFQAQNNNPGFIGIHVHSKNTRHDMIYNDDNPMSENAFTHGTFRGRTGVVTLDAERIESMLLVHGRVLVYGPYGIRLQDQYGDVHLTIHPQGIEVASTSEFQLSVPVPNGRSTLSELVLMDEKTNKTFTGEISSTGSTSQAVFELPVLDGVELRYK